VALWLLLVLDLGLAADAILGGLIDWVGRRVLKLTVQDEPTLE